MNTYINYDITHNLNELNRLRKLNNRNINKKTFVVNNTKKKDYKLKLFHKNIKKVNHNENIGPSENIEPSITYNVVYQYNYKNKDVTGFGDFIRGIYYMLQFSEKYNVTVNYYINNHIIKNYMNYFVDKPNISEDIRLNIPFFDYDNFEYCTINNEINYNYINIDNILLKFLSELDNYNNNKYFYIINHPNKELITDKHREIVMEMIKPTDYIYNITERALTNLNLIKKNFITLHIRRNDECFSNKEFLYSKNTISSLVHFIQKIYTQYKLDILLLSSDNNIKFDIIKQVPYVKTVIHNISHTCNSDIHDESIVNTLKEFYIMSYSKYIYSFSVYKHGSGFSKWCATTYNIPYTCYFLE